MNKVRATYKRSLTKDEYRMKTVISSSKCSMWGGSLVAHEIGHGVYKFQHTFDYGVAEKSTDNLMDYNNGDFLAHYQWRVMQDSVMFVWGLFQDDEDGMGLFDRFHWLGRNTSSMFTASKSIFFDTPEEDKVEAHESLFEEISECVGNKKPYITEEGWTYRTSWKPWNFPEMSNLLKQIIETKQVNLKNVKANNYYYSDIDADYFSGRVFAFVFKNSPVLSDYKVEELEQLMLHKRSKAVYYGRKYSMIPFYSKSGDLILALMFVSDDKNKNKYREYDERYIINFEYLTTKIARKLLVDPSLSVLSKCDAAILSAHVYGKDDKDYDVWYKPALKSTDWEVDTMYLSEVEKNHLDCGFKSQLYKKGDANIYCYVTAGTEGFFDPDALTDGGQVLGLYLHQYIHSVANAKMLKEKIEQNGGQLFFAGHSLGGGLATCNSLATGCPAKTFNPAAISQATSKLFTNYPFFLYNHAYDSQMQEELSRLLAGIGGMSTQQAQEAVISCVDNARKLENLKKN